MKGVATGQLRTVPNQIQFGSLEIQIERAVGPKMALGATFGGSHREVDQGPIPFE